MAGSSRTPRGPHFNYLVAENGYAWWYIDALSDDKMHGLTLIAFIGSVFSPYYARARRKAEGDPNHHVALNVALYGKSGHRWTMTERGRNALHQSPRSLSIGPSCMLWDGEILTVNIDEITVPFPSRIKGSVRLKPSSVLSTVFTLDEQGDHMWGPIAPIARVSVQFENGLQWEGNGYFDWNGGGGPLEKSFQRWDWSRASDEKGAIIFYDICRRNGVEDGLAIEVDPKGSVKTIPAPPVSELPSTRLWRLKRETRSDGGMPSKVIETLEDTPFYARSLISSRVHGRDVLAVHESLSLDRFVSPLVQLMLPFRMPRRSGSLLQG